MALMLLGLVMQALGTALMVGVRESGVANMGLALVILGSAWFIGGAVDRCTATLAERLTRMSSIADEF